MKSEIVTNLTELSSKGHSRDAINHNSSCSNENDNKFCDYFKSWLILRYSDFVFSKTPQHQAFASVFDKSKTRT